MDRNKLRWLLQKMEKEARSALFTDGSFLEALQALKWQVESDAQVRAATLALQERGINVFTSFVPRIRIRLFAGETVLAPKDNTAGSSYPDIEDRDPVTEISSEPITRELCDAASAAIAASPYCRHLDVIVNEAVKANGLFDRLAAAIERAGYELQISLDVSTYAQVRGPRLAYAQSPNGRVSPAATQQFQPTDSDDTSGLYLSSDDMQFLKDLRISLD